MLRTLRSAYQDFRKFDDEHRDRRSEHYLIMSNAWHMVGLISLYFFFVKHIGPKIMAKRKPYELKWVLLFYNMAQVLINLYFGIRSIYHVVIDKPYDNIFCMMPNLGTDYIGRLELDMAHSYFLLKIADFLDTVFFVLRKRNNQITFLHVYHHIMVSVCGYVFLRWVPGGQPGSFCLVNSFVHAIMYFYYFLSALRPELKQSLWWKKHITQVQLIQFFILLVHYGVPLVRGNCAFPRVALQLLFTQNVVMVVLFSKFYYGAYIRKPTAKTTKQQLAADNGATNGIKSGVMSENGCTKKLK